MDSPRSRRNTTSRLRPTLQRWPGANRPIVEGFGVIPGKPVDSVDGLRPPSLTTGATATSVPSISRLMAFITPVSSLTNSCPEKPGAAHDFQTWRNDIQIPRNEIQAGSNEIQIRRNEIKIQHLCFSMAYLRIRLRRQVRPEARLGARP